MKQEVVGSCLEGQHIGSSLILHDWISYIHDAAIVRGGVILQEVQRMSVLNESGRLEADIICMRVMLVLFLV